ncbi:MAG: hypothetical protein ACYCQI_02075 [Gammaproteobacteria bacterium]
MSGTRRTGSSKANVELLQASVPKVSPSEVKSLGFFTNLFGSAPKPEVGLIEGFFAKYGELSDTDLTAIDLFCTDVAKIKATTYVYHALKLKSDAEEAYKFLQQQYAKDELIKLHSALAKAKIENLQNKSLKDLVRLIKAEIDAHHADKIPKMDEKQPKKEVAPPQRSPFIDYAKKNLTLLEKENELEVEAHESYKALHKTIKDGSGPISRAANDLRSATSALRQFISLTGHLDTKLVRLKSFYEAKKEAQERENEFKKHEDLVESQLRNYELNHGVKINAIDGRSRSATLEDQVTKLKSSLSNAIEVADTFERDYHRQLFDLAKQQDHQTNQLEVARNLLKNLKETFSDISLQTNWSKECYTFMGMGGVAFNIGGNRSVKVPQGVLQLRDVLHQHNMEIITLVDAKKLLGQFKEIVNERMRVRQDTSSICCLPFWKVKVRQDTTRDIYNKISALNVEHLQDGDSDLFAINNVFPIKQEQKYPNLQRGIN